MPEVIMFSATLLKVKVMYPDFSYKNKHLSLGKYVCKFTFTCVIISFPRFLHIRQGIESPSDTGWKNESKQSQRLEEDGLMIFVEKQFLEGIFQSPCFCLVLFVWYLGDLFCPMQNSFACKALLMDFQMQHPSEVKQTVSTGERFDEALDCPEASFLCCSSVWSALVSETCTCSKQGLVAQGCVCDGPVAVETNGVLKLALRFPSALIPWRG